MTFEPYSFKPRKPRSRPERNSHPIPWDRLLIGDCWLCFGRSPSSLKQTALSKAPREFSFHRAINGTLIKRDK